MDDPLAGDTVSTRARVWHTPYLLVPYSFPCICMRFMRCFVRGVCFGLCCVGLCSRFFPFTVAHTHTHTFVARFLLPSLLFLVSFSFFVSCLKSRSPVVSGSGRDRQTSTDARGKIGLGFLCYELLCTAKVVLLATSWLTPRQMMLLLVLALHL